jgi:hypothetical protein
MYIASAFLLASLALTALAFSRHPVYGVYLYFMMTYVYPQGRWWGDVLGDIRWSFLAGCIAIAAALFHFGKAKPKPLWLANVPTLALLAYCAWMWIQMPWVLDFESHLSGSTLFFKSLVALWFVYRVADTPEHVRDLVFANVVGCALLGVLAYLTGRQGDRLDGVGGPGLDDANTLGTYFATAAILAGGLVLTEHGWRRWVSLGCGVCIMQGLVLTNTRGAFLGLLAGAIVLFLTHAKHYRRTFLLTALIGLVGVAIIADKKFIDRMTTIETAVAESEEADGSALSRFAIVRAQLEMFQDHPMGTGFRGTAALSPQYLERQWLTVDRTGLAARSSHNTFMTALVEQGFPGAILYLIVLLWVLSALWRIRAARAATANPELNTLAGAICGALVALYVAGQTADFLLAEIQFWLLPLLVTAMQMLGLSHTASRETPQLAGAGVERGSPYLR